MFSLFINLLYRSFAFSLFNFICFSLSLLPQPLHSNGKRFSNLTGWIFIADGFEHVPFFVSYFKIIFISFFITHHLYPRSVTFFSLKLSFSFFCFFFSRAKFTLGTKFSSCNFVPLCKFGFVQFCALVQFCSRAI